MSVPYCNERIVAPFVIFCAFVFLEWRARQVKPHRVGDRGALLIMGAISDCNGEWYVVEVVGVLPSVREAEASVSTNLIGEYGVNA